MSKKRRRLKKLQNKARHEFLLQEYFDDNHRYEAKEVNGFMLVRQLNNNTKRWEVATYYPSAYEKSQEYYQTCLLENFS